MSAIKLSCNYGSANASPSFGTAALRRRARCDPRTLRRFDLEYTSAPMATGPARVKAGSPPSPAPIFQTPRMLISMKSTLVNLILINRIENINHYCTKPAARVASPHCLELSPWEHRFASSKTRSARATQSLACIHARWIATASRTLVVRSPRPSEQPATDGNTPTARHGCCAPSTPRRYDGSDARQ